MRHRFFIVEFPNHDYINGIKTDVISIIISSVLWWSGEIEKLFSRFVNSVNKRKNLLIVGDKTHDFHKNRWCLPRIECAQMEQIATSKNVKYFRQWQFVDFLQNWNPRDSLRVMIALPEYFNGTCECMSENWNVWIGEEEYSRKKCG